MDLSTGEPSAAPVPLPPPPPPQPPTLAPEPSAGVARGWTQRAPRAGELTTGWRVATAIVWAFAFVALIAVWKTSRELGLNTWWLGPLGDPQPWFVTMVPFVAPVTMIVLAYNNSRYVPQLGLAASAAVAVVAVVDIPNVPRLAAVELAIAAAGALVSVAGFAGRYRPAAVNVRADVTGSGLTSGR